MTLETVAKLAGVSMMTVSRVVNGPESVTPVVRETVRKAIAETGYVPNLLYLTGTSHSAETRRQLRAAKIPIVETWDLSHKPIDMAVGFSHRAVGQAVGEFFEKKGYCNVAVFSANDERATQRRDALVATLAQHGITDVSCLSTPPPSTLPMGRDALGKLLDSGFRGGAIHCSSDAMAHGVLIEAQARGLSLPGDIAVIGFGNLDYAAYTSPPLSTVRVNRFTVGRLAAEALLARLSGNPVERKVIDTGFDIVERATT